jgi:hypothetical protein
VKNTNNAKGVVGHQVEHQFEAPILFGSLNTVLLSKCIHDNNILLDHTIEQFSSSHLNSAENCNFIDTDFIFHDHAVKDRESAPFKADSASGLEKILSVAALGSELLGAAGLALPLGRQSTAGAAPLADAPPPGVTSPRTPRAQSPCPRPATCRGRPPRELRLQWGERLGWPLHAPTACPRRSCWPSTPCRMC